jgi:hypothetical protein
MKKTCIKCNKIKPLTEFYKDRCRPDGYRGECKSCRYIYESSPKNKQRKRERERRLQATPKYRLKKYKVGAKARKIDWGLTEGEFMSFWQRPCRYCNSPIETIGLDRIDNTEGYSLPNVIPCCTVCNKMKGTLTMNEFIAQCIAVEEWSPMWDC